jgi:hypothetical protein
VQRVTPAMRTILLQFQLVRRVFLVFHGGIIPPLALLTGEGDD